MILWHLDNESCMKDFKCLSFNYDQKHTVKSLNLKLLVIYPLKISPLLAYNVEKTTYILIYLLVCLIQWVSLYKIYRFYVCYYRKLLKMIV